MGRKTVNFTSETTATVETPGTISNVTSAKKHQKLMQCKEEIHCGK